MNAEKCQYFSDIAKRAAGWTFAHLFNFYFGNTTLVLEREGSSGEDLELFISEKWLEENHVLNFVKGESVDTRELDAHLKAWKCDLCRSASERLSMINPFFREGLPGGIALVSVVQSRGEGSRCEISRDNGWGDQIDLIKPLVKWFTDDRDFWNWPK